MEDISMEMSFYTQLRRWWCALAVALLVTLTSSLTMAADIPQGPLVSTAWLHDNLSHPEIRIIEVSVNPGVYERGHIPGAVNFSWHHDLNNRVQRDIVSPEDFGKLL